MRVWIFEEKINLSRVAWLINGRPQSWVYLASRDLPLITLNLRVVLYGHMCLAQLSFHSLFYEKVLAPFTKAILMLIEHRDMMDMQCSVGKGFGMRY